MNTAYENRVLRTLDILDKVKRPYSVPFMPDAALIGGALVCRRLGATGYGVYFIHAGNLTKIGVSSRLKKRLSELRTASPLRLYVAGVIYTENQAEARSLERELHVAFSPVRMHGEWFQSVPVLREFIRLRATEAV